MLSDSGRPRRAPWVNCVASDEQTYQLSSKRSQSIVLLDDISAVIWGLCDGNHSCKQILSLFASAYPDHPEVEQDVAELILSLIDQQLLVIDGGDSALEYQGNAVRTLEPTSRLIKQLEIIRNYIFSELRIPEAGSIDSDLSQSLGEQALQAAKQRDANAASNDHTVITFRRGLTSGVLQDPTEKCAREIQVLLPEIDAKVELSGEAIYLRGAHMGWHSNHSRSDGRVYCSWSEQADRNFFRYENPLTGQIVTRREQQGWNIKSFTIPPGNARFWHCIGAESLRLSIGFRYSLPN